MDTNVLLALSPVDEQSHLLVLAGKLRDANEDNWRDVLQSIVDEYGRQEQKNNEKQAVKAEKDKLVKELLLFLSRKLREGVISFDDMPDVASYILSWYDRIFSPSDIGDFLYLLKTRWEFFSQFDRLWEIQHLPPRAQIQKLVEGYSS